MSCLNLKRLLPHRKVWKVLTNKLHLRLSRSKANKKWKHRSHKTSKKVCWPSLSIQPKKFKKHPNFHSVIHHKNHHSYSHRRPPPVFVDHLYTPPVSVVKEHAISPGETSKQASASSVASLKKSENLNHGRPESCKEETRAIEYENNVNADDMWESLVLNSSQMHGINEKAEEFITRFRANMRQQEIQAGRL